MTRVKVIVIYSLAYSGTTWTTLVLGSREDVFCLGAGDRAFTDGPRHPDRMCVIHSKCSYWPGFFATYSSDQNFFQQLQRYSGRDTFVINNPSIPLFNREFVHEGIDLRVIKQVRNGQACLSSAMKHHPERVQSIYQSAIAWLYRGTRALERRVANTRQPSLLVRYEDAVRNPEAMLGEVAAFTGVPYTADSLCYWDHDHHIVGGNEGALRTLAQLRGGGGGKGQGYYADLVRHLRATRGIPKLDTSWSATYGPADLAAYDFVAGEQYEQLGYPRPAVDSAAIAEFRRIHNPPSSVAEAEKLIGPWRLPAEQPGSVGKQTVKNYLKSGLGRLSKRWTR